MDVTGKVQGPFKSSDMDDWNSQGYFNPTLMIAYENAEFMEDFVPLMLYQKHPGVFLQMRFTRNMQSSYTKIGQPPR